jgi:hypothetical protein
LLAILFRLRGTNKDRSILRRCLRAWRGLIGRGGWVESMGDYLCKQKSDLLMRRVIHSWRNEAGRSSRDRKLSNIAALHESELQRTKADADLSTSALKVELLGCKDSIARANEEKAILQERLKSHMMRGMCALNAEATMLLRGMAAESGMQMTLPENLPPRGGAPSASHFVQKQQQNVPSFPEYGGAAGQGSAATDSLLAMQGNINAQLAQLQSMPDGYVPGQHSVNFSGTQPPRPAPLSSVPAPVVNNTVRPATAGAAASGGSRSSSRHSTPAGGSGLVSFNNAHPAVGATRLPVREPGTPRR